MCEHIANLLFDSWATPYSISKCLRFDLESLFGRKIFAIVRALLKIWPLKTILFHPKANGQVEYYNKTIATRLHHYVAEIRRIRNTLSTI